MLKKSIIALALGILFVMTSLFSVAGDILESSDENEYPVMEFDENEYPVMDFEVIPIAVLLDRLNQRDRRVLFSCRRVYNEIVFHKKASFPLQNHV